MNILTRSWFGGELAHNVIDGMTVCHTQAWSIGARLIALSRSADV